MATKKMLQINGYVPLTGSEKAAPSAVHAHPLNTSETMSVTIHLRRKKSIEPALKTGKHISHEEYEKNYGAAQEDLDAVEYFAQQNHLTVAEINVARRSIVLTGKIKYFETAFSVHLSQYQDVNGSTFRGRSGSIHIPKHLERIIEGVFGLDDRPHATPKFKVLQDDAGKFTSHAAASNSFTAAQIAELYGFPNNVNGQGQCIGIIELGGGYRTTDLNNYFKDLGITPPAIKAKAVDGGHNSPSTADSADGEVMLDIEVAGTVAPGAKQVVYFAGNTDQGFLDAVTTAIHDAASNPSVISISWGSAEVNWTTQSLNAFNEAFKAASLLGITICVASGDDGSSDSVNDGKVHVDFPASSPYALACGGTGITVKANKIITETVWHDSNTSAGGGGVSEFFPLADYQKNKGIPVSISTKFKGRGVPDVAGNADPESGYQVLVDGQQIVVGGTSAVAPLMAGLIALLNQKNKNRAGFVNPKLYATPTKFCKDIVGGNNSTTKTKLGYNAGPGWDACTGWGVMNTI